MNYLKDAHTEHCCIIHGCKYSDPDCTVANGVKPQSMECETCGLIKSGYYGDGDQGPIWSRDYSENQKPTNQQPVAHICENGKVRPYPDVLCSCHLSSHKVKNLSIFELTDMVNKLRKSKKLVIKCA